MRRLTDNVIVSARRGTKIQSKKKPRFREGTSISRPKKRSGKVRSKRVAASSCGEKRHVDPSEEAKGTSREDQRCRKGRRGKRRTLRRRHNTHTRSTDARSAGLRAAYGPTEIKINNSCRRKQQTIDFKEGRRLKAWQSKCRR